MRFAHREPRPKEEAGKCHTKKYSKNADGAGGREDGANSFNTGVFVQRRLPKPAKDENYERELERVSRFGGVPPAPMAPSDVPVRALSLCRASPAITARLFLFC